MVVLDRDTDKCEEISRELGDGGVVVCGSVLEDADVQRAIEAAQGFGSLRGVVACAGGGGPVVAWSEGAVSRMTWISSGERSI